jgi:predicted DNA-binding transcriptional regulator AlpA
VPTTQLGLGIVLASLVNQKIAAQLLGISVRTLERYRVVGSGPRYVRLGRLIRYRQVDIEDFVKSNLCTSTSEVTWSYRRDRVLQTRPIGRDRREHGSKSKIRRARCKTRLDLF